MLMHTLYPIEEWFYTFHFHFHFNTKSLGCKYVYTVSRYFRDLSICSFIFLIPDSLGQQNKMHVAMLLFITAVSHHCNYQQQEGTACTHYDTHIHTYMLTHNQSCVIMVYTGKYLAVSNVSA